MKHKIIPSHLWTLKFDFDEIGPHFWKLHSFLIIFILSAFVLCIDFDVYAPRAHEAREKHICTIIVRTWVSVWLVNLSGDSYFWKTLKRRIFYWVYCKLWFSFYIRFYNLWKLVRQSFLSVLKPQAWQNSRSLWGFESSGNNVLIFTIKFFTRFEFHDQ